MRSFLERIQGLWKAHAGQEAFLLAEAKTKVLACGRRWGKTDACAMQVVGALAGGGCTRQLLLAPTLDQAMLLFDRILQFLDRLLDFGALKEKVEALRRTPYPRFKFLGHTVTARSGHNARALRGNEATHIVVDEAAFVPETLITDVAMPMLATTGGSMTMISTPNGRNHFWRFFDLGQRSEHGFWSRRSPSSEAPHVSRDFLAVQKETISERAYAVEYDAEFRDSVGQVFSSESIDKCIVPSIEGLVDGPFSIGIDFGRYQDWSAVAVLSGYVDGAVLVEAMRLPQASWETQNRYIAEILARYPNASVLGDATGLGDVTIGQLNAMLGRRRVQEYVFSLSSKAQLIENLVLLMDHGRLKMEPNPQLLRELQNFEAALSPSGNRRLNAMNGSHDDLVIALALAAWDLPKRYGMRVVLGQPRSF